MHFDFIRQHERELRAGGLWALFCCLILPSLSFFETSLLMFIDSRSVTLQLMMFGWILLIGSIVVLPIIFLTLLCPMISRALASAYGAFSFVVLKLLYLPFFYSQSILAIASVAFLIWACLLIIVLWDNDRVVNVTTSLALTLSAVLLVAPLLIRFAELSVSLGKALEHLIKLHCKPRLCQQMTPWQLSQQRLGLKISLMSQSCYTTHSYLRRSPQNFLALLRLTKAR